jgi:hypothetical protein
LEAVLAEENEPFDVVFLTETHLSSDDPDELFTRFKNFNVFRSDRVGREDGGVAAMVRNGLNTEIISQSSFDGFCEVLWIKIETVLFGVVYRTPSTNLRDKYNEDLRKDISKHCDRGDDTVLVGDFNLPGLYPVVGQPKRAYAKLYNRFCDYGFTQLVDSPTRGENILDLVLSTDPLLVSEVETGVPISDCDHEVVTFNVNIPPPPLQKTMRPDFHRADYEGMSGFLESVDWPALFANADVEEKWETFKHIMEYAVHLFVPMKSTTPSPKGRSPVSPESRAKLKVKKKSYFNYRRTRSEANRNKLKTAARIARASSRRDRIRMENAILTTGNNKSFFKFVNSQLTSRGTIPVLVNKDGVRCTSSKTKSECLNDQYHSVFTRDDGNLPPFAVRTEVSIDMLEISDEIVFRALKRQKSKTSRGPDDIPPILLNKCAGALSSPLAEIFRDSLSAGVLPKDWLQAIVVPIYKRKGKTSDPGNYRPVSLTSACCKVMEHIVTQKILDHLRSQNLLTEKQHGFLSKKSTLTNTMSALKSWHAALDEGKVVHAVFLDFAKAFDTVSHTKLLHKLHAYGVEGFIFGWIKAFLANRTQMVRVGDAISDPKPVSSGVPQGSVLGPLLFLIYINDMLDSIVSDSLLYADDAKLYRICDRALITDLLLANSLSAIHEWSQTWQLSLSIPKCKVFCFGTPSTQPVYEIAGVTLEREGEISDLGVLLSADAKTSEHCLAISKKGLGKVALIYNNFRCRNRDFLTRMFSTFVLPIVSYNSPVWSPFQITDINRVERVLRTFTRRVPGLGDLPYPRRLKALNMCSLEETRLRTDLILTYRILKGQIDLNRADFFEASLATRTRGHSLKLQKHHGNLQTTRNFFSSRVVDIWNALPEATVSSSSLPVFKARLKDVDLTRFLKGDGAG